MQTLAEHNVPQSPDLAILAAIISLSRNAFMQGCRRIINRCCESDIDVNRRREWYVVRHIISKLVKPCYLAFYYLIWWRRACCTLVGLCASRLCIASPYWHVRLGALQKTLFWTQWQNPNICGRKASLSLRPASLTTTISCVSCSCSALATLSFHI